MNNKILITGAGGYIGSVLIPLLLSAGNRITAVDTFWFGKSTLPTHKNLTILKCDTRIIPASAFVDVDIVIDMAALSNDPCGERFTKETWGINHHARLRTAKLSKWHGVKRYLMTSSCSVYGSQSGLLSESSPTNPLTEYAKANLATENALANLDDANFSITILRLSTLFGLSPRMRLDLVVNRMCFDAWKKKSIIINGDGSQHRPLLNVNEAANIIMLVIMACKKNVGGQIFNSGFNTSNYTITEIAEKICSVTEKVQGRIPEIIYSGAADKRTYQVNFDKLSSTISLPTPKPLEKHAEEIMRYMESSRLREDEWYNTLAWYTKKNIFGQCDGIALNHENEIGTEFL